MKPLATLRTSLLCAALAAALPAAHADGLRMPRYGLGGTTTDASTGLRFSVSQYTGSLSEQAAASPLILDLGDAPSSTRGSALWADWYPFQSMGLRTSVGLSWRDPAQRSDGFSANSGDGRLRRGFVGVGWTSAASSASSGTGWRLSADLGASFQSSRDCNTASIGCISPGFGLKPGSGGEGIRWNPFISIGASFQY